MADSTLRSNSNHVLNIFRIYDITIENITLLSPFVKKKTLLSLAMFCKSTAYERCDTKMIEFVN